MLPSFFQVLRSAPVLNPNVHQGHAVFRIRTCQSLPFPSTGEGLQGVGKGSKAQGGEGKSANCMALNLNFPSTYGTLTAHMRCLVAVPIAASHIPFPEAYVV